MKWPWQKLNERAEMAELSARQANQSADFLQERLADLERTLYQEGWEQLGSGGYLQEFSRTALRTLISLARLAYIKNPLIRRAVNVQTDYVYGQGCNIHLNDEKANRIVDRFLEDPMNQEVYSSAIAMRNLEIELQITGNLFLSLHTDKKTARTLVRPIDVDEITNIIANPDDRYDVWFFERTWSQYANSGYSVGASTVQKVVLYPDLSHYWEGKREKTYNGVPVEWERPILHIKCGGLSTMKFGIPEIYAAMDWATAVRRDLEDYSTIRRALAKFAWKATTKGGTASVAAIKDKFQTARASMESERNPLPTSGSIWVANEGINLEPVRTAGSAPSPEEGRRLWLMVGAALGLPETILAGDANIGTYATAKSLDRPTELKMVGRRDLWAMVHTTIITHQIVVAAETGQAQGIKVERDPVTGAVKLNGGDLLIHVDWPPLLERDAGTMVNAIISAGTLNGMQPSVISYKTMARMLLSVLGEKDIDKLIKDLPEDLPVASQPMQGEEEQGLEEFPPEEMPGIEAATLSALANIRKELVEIRDGNKES